MVEVHVNAAIAEISLETSQKVRNKTPYDLLFRSQACTQKTPHPTLEISAPPSFLLPFTVAELGSV